MDHQPLQGMRILVVEDEYYMADDLVQALQDAGASPVGPCNSVHQAEQAIERDGIDAAVLDLNLHGQRTDKLVKRLDDAKVQILIVSGYSETALPPELRHLNRLEKPVDCGHVISCLADQLGSRTAPA